MTLQDAVKLPSAVVAVIVALPAATAVTVPLFETVATEVLLEVHVTVLFAASLGVTVAVRLPVAPTLSVSVVGLSVMPVTAIVWVLTLTLQVLLKPPSAVVAVIVALPTATAVTVPLIETVAMELLLEVYVMLLFVALLGVTVAVRLPDAPTFSVNVVGLSVMPVTLTVWGLAVTLTVPDDTL